VIFVCNYLGGPHVTAATWPSTDLVFIFIVIVVIIVVVAETCEVQNGGCDDVCIDTSHGPRCSCSPGLLLNDTDMHTCTGERPSTGSMKQEPK